MQAVIYAKADYGMPTTTQIADLSDRMADVEYTTAAFWGPLEARIRWTGTVDEGYDAADQWLGNPIAIYSPDAEWCWEGIVWSVTFGAGTRQRSRSLDGYANRVIVHWNSVAGPQAPVEAQDIPGQYTYGIIDYQHNAGTLQDATAAATLASELLSQRNRPLYIPVNGEGDTVELYCQGWFRTLEYQFYTQTATGSADITTIVENILAASAPMLRLMSFPDSGVSGDQVFNDYETPRELIKRLMLMIPGYVFSIGQNRTPTLQLSQRLSTTGDYSEDTTGLITNATGAEIPPYLVRPDTILRQSGFAPINIGSTAIDGIESIYLVETTYSSRDGTVSYAAAVAGVLGDTSQYG